MFRRLDELVRRHAGLLKGVAAACTALALFLFLRALPLQGLLAWLKDQVETLGPWAPVVFVLLFVGLTAVLLPGWPLNVASGALFGPAAGGAITSLASTTAAAFSFLLGRWVAHHRVARRIRQYPKLHAVYRALGSAESWKVVAAVRLSHALPFGLQNFLLGVTPVPFWPYLLTTWAITLPGIFMIAYLGYLGATAVENQEALSDWQWLARAVGFLVAAGALLYVGRVVYRAIKEQTHLDLDEDNSAESQGTAEPAALASRRRTWLLLGLLCGALLLLAVAAWTYANREQILTSSTAACCLQAQTNHRDTEKKRRRNGRRKAGSDSEGARNDQARAQTAPGTLRGAP